MVRCAVLTTLRGRIVESGEAQDLVCRWKLGGLALLSTISEALGWLLALKILVSGLGEFTGQSKEGQVGGRGRVPARLA